MSHQIFVGSIFTVNHQLLGLFGRLLRGLGGLGLLFLLLLFSRDQILQCLEIHI